MSKKKENLPTEMLFDRIAAILDNARGNIIRTVNNNVVNAYWLIGREIVQELQNGEERAGYGEKCLKTCPIGLQNGMVGASHCQI